MKSAVKTTVTLLLVLPLLFACKRDELDLNKLSKQLQNERLIAIPLVSGSLSMQELLDNDSDSLITINGDTLSIYFRKDSLLNYQVTEFASIPQQAKITYTSSPPVDIPVAGRTVLDTMLLEVDTNYTFGFSNSMRLDSAILNQGKIILDVNNTYRHSVTLIITCTSLRNTNGDNFIETISNIPPESQSNYEFDIANYTIRTFEEPDKSRSLRVKFHPVLNISPGVNEILAANSLEIDFGFSDLNDFNAIFGFFGYQSVVYDTVLSDYAGDFLSGLSGTLNITNPKFSLIYEQSFGLGASIDFYLEAYHKGKSPVVINPPLSSINYSTDYKSPKIKDDITWNRNTISNIDELIAFPIPDSVLIRGDINVNQGEDSLTSTNYALWDSKLNVGLEIEIPLELRADLTYQDSIKLDTLIDDEAAVVEIEYLNIDYWFENYFPIGFGTELILVDTIKNVTLDTISFNATSGQLFLSPAPVDANGDVLKDQVQRVDGVITLTKSAAENLINSAATHLVVQATIITTERSSVKVKSDCKLDFHLGLDGKLKYTTTLNNETEN